MDRFVIQQARPWRDRLLSVLLGLVIFILLAAAFVYGRQENADAFSRLVFERDRAVGFSRELSEKYRVLRERVAVSQRGAQIDRATRERTSAELAEVDKQVRDLTEELAFFRSIAIAQRLDRGLRIGELSVTPVPGSQRFRFRLVLTHVLKSDKVLAGTLHLTVAGEQGGGYREVSLEEVSGNSGVVTFSMRHFKALEGHLDLPPNFVPLEVLVRITTRGKRPHIIEKTFDWPLTGSVG